MNYKAVSAKHLRSYMEDRLCIVEDFFGEGSLFGGVYDGHMGVGAAEYTAFNLHERVLFYLQRGESIADSFARAYREINWCISSEGLSGGTMAVNFFVLDGKIYIAESGDCKVVIAKRDGSFKCLTKSVYNMRSLGDTTLNPEFYFREYEITAQDLMLVAGSDGLFDAVSEREVASICLRYHDPQEAVDRLKGLVIDRPLVGDNFTIIAVDIS